MKLEITEDSPILLKLIPETQLEIFQNGHLHARLQRMKVDYRTTDKGTLIFNIDPNYPDDFTDHEEPE